jgi:tetratricopeptide (TPR) repeat protein
MQNNLEAHNKIGELFGTDRKKRKICASVFTPVIVLAFAVLLILPDFSLGAEKRATRKTPSQQKEVVLNDSTVLDAFKKAEEQLKKGELESSLATLIRIHDYSEDVLKTVKYFQAQYEKVVNDSSIAQHEKEDIFIKLKRMGQLTPKYKNLREVSAYDIGLIYAKKGEAEKARKYLLEVLETSPFSTKNDSPWMKTKKLLLGLYHLEGEF